MMLRTKTVSPEVLFADEPLVTVTREDIERLKVLAAAGGRRRARLCAHRDLAEPLHDMLIVHTRETYVRPHKHLGRAESFHIVEGRADVVILSDTGAVEDVIAMGEYASGLRFYYRLADPRYHTLLIRSPFLVFHESTTGPFDRSGTRFPDWAPDEGDGRGQQEYLTRLGGAVEAWLAGRRPGVAEPAR